MQIKRVSQEIKVKQVNLQKVNQELVKKVNQELVRKDKRVK